MTSNVFGSQPAIKKNWSKIQSTTFTNWINQRLKLNGENGASEPIRDLTTALQDGDLLIKLVENLTGVTKARKNTRQPRLRVQKLADVGAALEYVREQGIKLVNIGKLEWLLLRVGL